jgi:hypothetical protein
MPASGYLGLMPSRLVGYLDELEEAAVAAIAANPAST